MPKLPPMSQRSVTSAVILAAGRGQRIRPSFPDAPKGFLRLGERPIVEESIERLLHAGVSDIVIVTGYAAAYYEELASKYPDVVRLVHNERFADSGSLYSLYRARELVSGPFLLLESDLVYETRALSTLLELDSSDAMLLSGPTNAGDEVYVATQDGCLQGMSKDPSTLSAPVIGEFVGISKISDRLLEELVRVAEGLFGNSLRWDYEFHGLERAAKRVKIPCTVVSDLVWTEIDDEAQFEHARDRVYPLLGPCSSIRPPRAGPLGRNS